MGKRLRELGLVEQDTGTLILIENEIIRAKVGETLARLPEEVYDALIRAKRVWFLNIDLWTFGKVEHLTTFGRQIGKSENGIEYMVEIPVVILGFELAWMGLEIAVGVIAHEIAHVWLHHLPVDHTDQKEQDADQLAESWGFDMGAYHEMKAELEGMIAAKIEQGKDATERH